MQSNTFILMLTALLAALVICFCVWIIAAIGSIDLTTGCLYRYSFKDDGSLSKADGITNTLSVKASGNYSAVDSGVSSTSLTLSQDPNLFGKWLNSSFLVSEGQSLKVEIRGDVSLCKSYLPKNNIQILGDTDVSGKRIPIPRVEDSGSESLSLIMDAKVGNWRNIAQLFPNDKIVVSLSRDKKSTSGLATQKDYINNVTLTADCTNGKRQYSPICGRFSIWSGSYVASCTWNTNCPSCHCGCYQNFMGQAPEPYTSNGFYTSPWRANPDQYFTNFFPSCSTDFSYMLAGYQASKFFWFSADNSAGLLYRYDANEAPTGINNRGSNFSVAAIGSNDGIYSDDTQYRVILNSTFNETTVKYLQYRLNDLDGGYADNTGGYVLNVKHTKCRRINGVGMDDVFANRGFVEYVILPVGIDPNTTTNPLSIQKFTPTKEGDAAITIPTGANGTMWLKIKNQQSDYADSFGQYQVKLTGQITKGSFFGDILNPIFEGFKSTVDQASQRMFKNMTCYQGIGAAEGNCTNFFNYVRGLLILYIMLYGMMFLIGMVQISQMDIVVRVIKVGLVAGLLNEETYNFFNSYVFGFVTHFNDEIIANMSGYSLFTSSNAITNPFMFLDEVMTKIFLSKTFGAQMMALLSMGMNGVLYFIIVFTALILVIIAALRGIAVYLMAYVAIAVLLGVAPLFLTFILFDFTRYLFENWVRFTFRYMIEPVVMLAGIIILTQLFTIYLDYVIGYSVCWKCALAIKIPFPDIPGLSQAFLNVPIFCINWFGPWGNDASSGQMGINMQHVVALVILAYCMKGYIDFSGKLVTKIAGASGGPSATRMGSAMADSIGNKVLESAGLDKKTRDQIKSQAQQRITGMMQNGSGGGGGGDGDPLDQKQGRMDGEQKDNIGSSGSKNGQGLGATNKGIQEQAEHGYNSGPGTTAPAKGKAEAKASSWKSAKPSQARPESSTGTAIGAHRKSPVTEEEKVPEINTEERKEASAIEENKEPNVPDEENKDEPNSSNANSWQAAKPSRQGPIIGTRGRGLGVPKAKTTPETGNENNGNEDSES